MNRTSWYSKAKILEVKYEYPILRMISGVKRINKIFMIILLFFMVQWYLC